MAIEYGESRRCLPGGPREYPQPVRYFERGSSEAAPQPTTKRPARFNIRGVKDQREMSAADIRNQLRLLELERLEAASAGLLEVESYKRDLEDEMAERRSAFVSAAVVEIARLRAELSDWQAAA
jgi:hypothetical protein